MPTEPIPSIPSRRGGRRGGRNLHEDIGFQELLTAISGRVDRVIARSGRSIAKAARDAGIGENALQALLQTRTDPKVSTLHLFARSRGYRVIILFEPNDPLPLDRLPVGG